MTDSFEVLGIKRRFHLGETGLEDLERRFHRLSRENHPDRFTTLGASAQKASLARMSELNQAYRTLKDTQARRAHLLELEKISLSESAKSSQIPLELAEGWFELQDALMEDPEGAPAKLAEFEDDFNGLNADREGEIADLEKQADEAADRGDTAAYRGLLNQIAEVIRQQSYLSSMSRDIERLRDKLTKAS